MYARIRLLRRARDGTYSFKTFDKGREPRYAILSHTWGLREDDDEVLYEDIIHGTYRNKEYGFLKLEGCAARAKKDRLEYFWVDTCCINKSNNTELSTAIRYMFRWYKNGERCYVFLADVSIQDGRSSRWEQELRNSRWFTRGWTLQELIAPSDIVFFSKEWRELGDKNSLQPLLSEVSGIPRGALDGSVDMEAFSVEERFAWVENRQTTEEEDKAYCMFAIFNVSLDVRYGEEFGNAQRRLEEEIQWARSGVARRTSMDFPSLARTATHGLDNVVDEDSEIHASNSQEQGAAFSAGSMPSGEVLQKGPMGSGDFWLPEDHFNRAVLRWHLRLYLGDAFIRLFPVQDEMGLPGFDIYASGNRLEAGMLQFMKRESSDYNQARWMGNMMMSYTEFLLIKLEIAPMEPRQGGAFVYESPSRATWSIC